MKKNKIQRLIDAKILSHQDVEEYLTEYKQAQNRLIERQLDKSEAQNKQTYSKIVNRILIKCDQRDIDKDGNYTVPDNVVKIAKYAFSDCKEITSVTLGPNVKSIESHGFFKCGLRYVYLNKVENIDDWAFEFCMNLEEVWLSRKLKKIGYPVFYNCIRLKKFRTPSGDTIILPRSQYAVDKIAEAKLQLFMEQNREVVR